MDKIAQNIQEAFLNNARKEKTFLTIYLMSGVKLSGRIKSFDKYSVILESNNQEQLIFKHAISTVVPARAVAFLMQIDKTAMAMGARWRVLYNDWWLAWQRAAGAAVICATHDALLTEHADDVIRLG